jgi:hypothetical protein
MMNDEAIRKLIGDPSKVAKELKSFRKTANVFSSQKAHLISRYSKCWVAAYNGEIVAGERTLRAVLKKLDELHISPKAVMIRFIDRNARKMILAGLR